MTQIDTTTLASWYARFCVEYNRRVGITWAEGCGEESVIRDYYHEGFTPAEAVQHQMDKYGLIDVNGEH